MRPFAEYLLADAAKTVEHDLSGRPDSYAAKSTTGRTWILEFLNDRFRVRSSTSET